MLLTRRDTSIKPKVTISTKCYNSAIRLAFEQIFAELSTLFLCFEEDAKFLQVIKFPPGHKGNINTSN